MDDNSQGMCFYYCTPFVHSSVKCLLLVQALKKAKTYCKCKRANLLVNTRFGLLLFLAVPCVTIVRVQKICKCHGKP